MENCDADTGMVDCGVGTIVWVRRRNGSWWPGKILGPDELSASHLMSPRSGTPVKLLGREDASVDWYNLEKSKRVKPFRCGEFDDCIERAEASQGMPPKKREKYARREDAILHALELEKQLLEKKYGKLGVQSNGLSTKLLGNVGKETTITPEISCDNGKHANSILGLSIEDKRKGVSLQAQSQLNVDDKSPDVAPRLRGLQDLGVGGIPMKYTLSSLTASNGSHKHDAAYDDGVSTADLHGSTPEITIGKNLFEKRKRSQEGNMEESIGKRRDRRRPLVQVLQSSAKLPRIQPVQQLQDNCPSLVGVGVVEELREPAKAIKSGDIFDYRETLPHDNHDKDHDHDQVEMSTPKFEKREDSFPVGLSEENNTTGGSNEDTETDSSGTESLISDTMPALSDEGEEDIEFIPKSFGRCGENESMSDDESGGVSDDRVSKWQLKGKRNSRRVRERKVSSGHWMSFKGEEMYNDDENNNNNNNNINRVRGGGGGGLLLDSSSSSHDMMNWEELTWNDEQQAGGGYWEQLGGEYHHDPPPPPLLLPPPVAVVYGGRMKSMLIEVDVQVRSGYQREHVPMISLMSKLNDKAIVGHPIPVEALEDGSSSDMIILSELQTESLGGGGSHDTTLQPWRTARRTAKCRVPRPPHLSTLEEEEEEEEDEDEDEVDEDDNEDEAEAADGKPPSVNRKSRKLIKKPQRRSSSSCNQKIRTLSSIGSHHQQQQQRQQKQCMDLKGEGEQVVMKPESLPTTVACIPVKLVFSRLHEELVARHQ